jgi:hypothetical protein
MRNPLDQLNKQTSIGQSRSSVLNPLQWMLVILVIGLGAVLGFRAQFWLVLLFAILICTTAGFILAAFWYLMIRELSSLRSEDYSLAKHAMDKGLFTEKLARQIYWRDANTLSTEEIQRLDAQQLKRHSSSDEAQWNDREYPNG